MKKFYCLLLMLLMASVISYAQQTQTLKELNESARGQETPGQTLFQPVQPGIEPVLGSIREIDNRPVSTQPVSPVSESIIRTQAREGLEPSLANSPGSGSGSRAVTDLTCSEWTLYSQVPDGIDHWSAYGWALYDNVITSPGGPIIKITWWMQEVIQDPLLSFDIIQRADNGSGQPGALITSFTGLVPGVDVTATNTGEIFDGYPVFEYTYYFPIPLTFNAGDWIGIQDYPDDYHHHFWLTSSDGDGHSWAYDGGSLYDHPVPDTDFAFCLGGRESDLTCPPGSIYSQTPDGINAWWSINGAVVYDNVLTSPPGPVGSITFWMIENSSEPSLTFDIIIRFDNTGEPGSQKAIYTNLTIPGINTGETLLGYPIYSYTYELPVPIMIYAGDWIGIADYPDNYIHHSWLTSSDGDGIGKGGIHPDYIDTETDYAFCLGEYEYNLFCPDESIYAQIPIGLDGWSTTDGFVFYDNILSPTYYPIGSITWWMIEGVSEPSLTFDIIFREDNGGLPGNIIASFTGLTVPGTNTGKFSPYLGGLPIYEYTYTFPTPVELDVNDWVGIADYPDDIGNHHHYWCHSDEGDGQIYGLYSGGSGYFDTPDLAFCLAPAPIIPISNWAIGIGIFLIIVFTVFRLRRWF